jgi:hypothetical protein
MQRERQRHRLLWGLLCTGGASDILTAYDYYVRMLLARESLAATDGALAVVNVVRQSWDYDGDCAAVAAGTDGSGFVCHVVRVCLALGFERERELSSSNVESLAPQSGVKASGFNASRT